MTACVRIRPGGPAVVVAATVVGVLVLLVGLVLALLVAYLITTDPPGWPALIPLMPSLLVMALSLWLVRRAASGFVLEAAGIRQAARHRAPTALGRRRRAAMVPNPMVGPAQPPIGG